MNNPLIIALDVESADQALSLIDKIGPAANFYKVGMELYAAAGMSLVKQIQASGRQVFLDLKLYDIGETVKRATRRICESAEPTFLTIHASKKLMQAAVEGRGKTATKLLAVTVLTSFEQADVGDLGHTRTIAELVDLRVAKAREAGMDGIVCSPLEVKRVRTMAGAGMKLVTPGVRSPGAEKDDQQRVATPAEALSDGADYIVIGRQVTRAADPKAACEQILGEIATTGAALAR